MRREIINISLVFTILFSGLLAAPSLNNYFAVQAQTVGSTCQYDADDGSGNACTGTYQEVKGQDGNTIIKCEYDDAHGKDCQTKGTADQVFGHVNLPAPLAGFGTGAKGIGTFLSNAVGLAYTAAGIIFVVMFFWAGFQWMLAGGDKEAVAKARARIINALIGLLLLAIAPLIFTIIGHVTGFDFPLSLPAK